MESGQNKNGPADDVPALFDLLLTEPQDELARVLWHAHIMLMKHPVAARAAFRALVAEGRRFAIESEEGARWKARLTGSDLIRRGRSVWELATLGMLTETPQLLPTQLIDMLCYTAGLTDLEPTLAKAVEPPAFEWATTTEEVAEQLPEESVWKLEAPR